MCSTYVISWSFLPGKLGTPTGSGKCEFGKLVGFRQSRDPKCSEGAPAPPITLITKYGARGDGLYKQGESGVSIVLENSGDVGKSDFQLQQQLSIPLQVPILKCLLRILLVFLLTPTMIWYNKLLAKKPHLLLGAVAVFCVACIVVALTTRRFPDFSDPTLGFEARGTTISQRLTAWRNLLEETRPSGRLLANPFEDFQLGDSSGYRRRKFKNQGPAQQKKRKKKKLALPEKIKLIKNLPNNGSYDLSDDYDSLDNVSRSSRHEHWDYGKNISYVSDESTKKRNKLKKENWIKLTQMYPPPLTTDVHTTSDGFFCESPNKEYSHFVMRRINHQLNESLFERNALLAMCDLEQVIVGTNLYNDLCQRELTNELIDVPAMDMGLKNALFDECLLSDGWLIGLGGIFIVVCMWMYTASLFVTAMTIVAIVFSLGVSYFIYTLIFELSFFPFMNLLAVVVILMI
uniref:SSD domain-containing protein n=1 Tax=Phlebotomus papatasi TaxID=29031 RepID=A0A1B0GM14_PHLPP